jgi:plastocyanin
VAVSIDPDWNPFNRGKFVPTRVTIKAGNLVTWNFKDTTAPHSVTADDGSFDSCQIVGEQGTLNHFTVRFSQLGTFQISLPRPLGNAG